MRTFRPRLILILFISLYFTVLFCQTPNWIYVAEEQSSAQSLTKLLDGNFLISSLNYGDSLNSQVAKISSTGELIWERKICNCPSNSIKFAAEQKDSSLVFVSGNGIIYTSNANGDNIFSGGRKFLSSSNSSNAWISLFEYSPNEEIVNFYGEIEIASVNQAVRVSLDIESLEFDVDIRESSSQVSAIAFSQSGLRAELHNPFLNPVIQYFDTNLVLISSVDIDLTVYNRFFDIAFDDSDNLYLAGNQRSSTDPVAVNGLIGMIDSDLNLRWTNQIPSPNGDTTLYIQQIETENERIIIGGSSGFILDTDAYIGEINEQGQLLWHTTFNVQGDIDDTKSFKLEDNSNNIIILGTAGQTDYSGPEKTYLASVQWFTSHTLENLNPNPLRYFPNPTKGILHIHSNYNYDYIEIISVTGSKIDHITPNRNTIDMSKYKAGLYYFRAFSDDRYYSSKVIKTR